MTGDMMEQDQAAKIIALVAKIAEFDPEAATAILSKEAGTNPFLAPLQGITIKGNKDGWIEAVRSPDLGGAAYMVYLPNLGEAIQAGQGSELWNETFIPCVTGDSVFLDVPGPHRRRWFHS
jgi:hypothetical protein